MRCRLLPYTVADGPNNMAADEALLESAAAGIVSLRFYGWTTATLSLGYFQPQAVRLTNPQTAPLPFVRRPSGGAALVHHHELTYALALPQGGSCWLCRVHHAIADALRGLGIDAQLCQAEQLPAPPGLLCFQHHTVGDVLLGGAKIVGSAQRRHRSATLQHGGILLAASPHAPELPGIRELAGRTLVPEEVEARIRQRLLAEVGWFGVRSEWTEAELRRTEELVQSRYNRDAWNCKR